VLIARADRKAVFEFGFFVPTNPLPPPLPADDRHPESKARVAVQCSSATSAARAQGTNRLPRPSAPDLGTSNVKIVATLSEGPPARDDQSVGIIRRTRTSLALPVSACPTVRPWEARAREGSLYTIPIGDPAVGQSDRHRTTEFASDQPDSPSNRSESVCRSWPSSSGVFVTSSGRSRRSSE
jgi:hypothetical protein